MAGPPDSPLLPRNLPPTTDSGRWLWLQRLRRSAALPLEPWLLAIEAGELRPDADLIAALASRFDAAAAQRLLVWWLHNAGADPALLQVIGQQRHPSLAAHLRAALAEPWAAERAQWLLPLVGHQRDPADFALLAGWLASPQPGPCRRAALEGLAVGLPIWPLPPLRRLLRRLLTDLDPSLAATALDLLARLPQPRLALAGVEPERLDPAVQRRRQRRLSALPANPLVLVVHGRGGGVIPAELDALRADVERRRRAPVVLQSLTGTAGPAVGPLRQAAAGGAITLMPLLLLPGGHVRGDVPALSAAWRGSGPVLRLPFLGAWPLWQRALRLELLALARAWAAAEGTATTPLLLHHPLQEGLASRYLTHLERFCQARCYATPYTATVADELVQVLAALSCPPPEGARPNGWAQSAGSQSRSPVLPLVLAANRLTDALSPWSGPPLLQRPRLRDGLLDLLVALP
ncbi:hypothetical protein IQ216_03775 [Cyanobium sp. LEGE 06143]|uniref:hypothetical protein n=1 Tax=Cyanobium sp. LEGE 06143 TaxID=945727 RepID=UPI00187E7353|nr:hypothetical protein [Cyanobium sp. LEGE 06143]MBE9172229.1 hypothetical protein [Cyanobium sp. LEGE 06143]